MSMEEEFAAMDGMDKAMNYVAAKLGIVLLQAKDSDKIYAVWIYKREVKGSNPLRYERQQMTATAKTKRAAIANVVKGMSELGSIDVSIKFFSYKEQMEIIRTQLGDNLLDF